MNELAKVVGLLAQRLGRQTIHECNHAMWEIMLGKPTDNHSLLHVRSSCYVQYQVAKLMPVPTAEQTTLYRYLLNTTQQVKMYDRSGTGGMLLHTRQSVTVHSPGWQQFPM